MSLQYVDHRGDPGAWARSLGISQEAVELYLASDVIDLHLESFSWARSMGYDLLQRHGPGLFNGRYYSQADLPRILEAGIGGAMWSITTNPFRGPAARGRIFEHSLASLRDVFGRVPEHVAVVRDLAEYRAARAAGRHAALLAIQGGNALDHDAGALDRIAAEVVRITLVHLSSSSLGSTNAPTRLGPDRGLTERGRRFVEELNARRVFVDLAHISRKGFFDAVEVHDPALPLLVTHTGVDGVRPCWRNVDDEQLRAVADSGGTVGVIFHSYFLGDPYFRGGRAERIVDHLEHICRTVGEDHASLGSDMDGAIVTPRDMPTCLELPRLVDAMLRRAFSAERVGKILGGNFLRALGQLRGSA